MVRHPSYDLCVDYIALDELYPTSNSMGLSEANMSLKVPSCR
jgi:hypothetical protein